MKKKLNSGYIEFQYQEPGKDTTYLHIPIKWDYKDKIWKGSLDILNTDFTIHIEGMNQEEFHNSFLKCVNELLFMHPNILENIKSMCMPAWYWEDI